MITESKIKAVQTSMGRCLVTQVNGKHFLDTFYDFFLNCDPRIKPMFAKTDLAKQKQLLKQGLSILVMYAGKSVIAEKEVNRLAEKHSRRGIDIAPSMYPLWVMSLLKAVQAHDKEYNIELDKQWREIVEHGIDQMKKIH